VRPGRVYTRTGDDGTTGLLGEGRVPKTHPLIELNGTIDEAQAFLGLARAECEPKGPLDELLIQLESDLWVVMAELAVGPKASEALRASVPATTEEMVKALEARIEELASGLDLERGFAVPGDNRRSAAFDVARSVVRRAERLAVALEGCPPLVLAYLNRLSDLCWVLARSSEQTHLVEHRPSSGRDARPKVSRQRVVSKEEHVQ
jgi:cob(I)alamin adenosyltransferase